MRRREDYTGWDRARDAKTITTGGTEEHREMLGSISTLARSFHHGGHEVSRRDERLEAMGMGPDTRKPSPQRTQRNTGERWLDFDVGRELSPRRTRGITKG